MIEDDMHSMTRELRVLHGCRIIYHFPNYERRREGGTYIRKLQIALSGHYLNEI